MGGAATGWGDSCDGNMMSCHCGLGGRDVELGGSGDWNKAKAKFDLGLLPGACWSGAK